MKETAVDKPTLARVDVVRDTYFGTVVEDPYRWMEDAESEESQAFIAAQAAYSRAYLDALPDRAALMQRISELADVVPLLYAYQIAGGRTFYLRRDPQDNVARLVVRTGEDAPEQTLFDPNALDGEAHTNIDWFTPSRDGRLVAYGISQGGSENSTLYVMNVDSGENLPDVITRTRFSGGALSWLEDGSGFFYHRENDLPPETPPAEQFLNTRSYLHRLGTDPDADPPIFGNGVNATIQLDPSDFPFAGVVRKSEWLFGFAVHGVLNEITLYAAPLSTLTDPATIPWQKVIDVPDAVTGVEVEGDTLYLRTHRDAPRYKIVSIDLREPDMDAARIVVPQSDVVIEGMVIAGDHLLVQDLDAGINRLRRLPLTGGEPEEVPPPIEGIIAGLVSDPDSPNVLLQMQSFIQSPVLYRYNAATGTMEDTGWIPPAPVDMSDIEVERREAPGKDGTPIPMTIIHRRGISRDGNNPTYLEAYGSYGLNYPVRYTPQMLTWYERGGILAVAHVRGGGEYGREWHEAGRLLNKQNTIDDFIAAAEYLIAGGYTRSTLLAGEGTSAGGIPSGNGLTQRPDLWAVMIMRVAVTDNFRMQYTQGGPANIPEFGDVTTEEGFKALQIADSYSKVRDGVAYPAVMLTTGLRDPRVVTWQATKMAARLQAATSSGRPILLRVEKEGGHGIGASKRQQDEELADILAFLLEQFGAD